MVNEEITNKKLREQNKQKLKNTYISKEIKKATVKDANYLDKYLIVTYEICSSFCLFYA